MLVSFLAVGLNLLFNWIFTFRLGWGHRGLAFSTGCVATCNFLLLYALMRRRSAASKRGACSRLSVRSRLRARLWPRSARPRRTGCWPIGPPRPFGARLALFGTVVVGGLVFRVRGAALNIEELNEVLAAIKRRLRRVR